MNTLACFLIYCHCLKGDILRGMLFLFFFFHFFFALGQVAYLNSDFQTEDGVTTVSIPNYSAGAGTDRLLVIHWQGNEAPTTVLVDGSTSGLVTHETDNIWYKVLGTNGSGSNHTITLNFANNAIGGLQVMSFSGVDQSTPADAVESNDLSGGGFSSSQVVILSESGDMVIDFCVAADADGTSPTFSLPGGSNQTSRMNVSVIFSSLGFDMGATGVASTEPGAVSVPMDWNISGFSSNPESQGEHFAFNLNQAPPLPVELLFFRAKETDKGIHLTWQTGNESNNWGFNIQKVVGSGQLVNEDWQTLKFVRGAGTSLDIQNYSYLDQDLSNKVHYYRLKQMDFDGRFTFSPIVSVKTTENSYQPNFKISPNPVVSDVLTIRMIGAETAKVHIYSLSGKLIKKIVIKSPETDIPTGNFSAGVYLLAIQSGNHRVFKKFLLR